MKVLESFMQKNKPAKRTSVMKSYRNEILKLFNDDYSVTQIQEFLKLSGVETTIGNIYYFIRSCKTQKNSKGGKNFSLQTNEENDNGENKETGDNNDTEVPNEEVTLTSMRRIMRERENNKEN